MTTEYSHSIRNRLFIVLSGDDLEYVVTNNDRQVVTFGKAAVTDKAMLADVLANTPPLSEIFSTVDLIWSHTSFVTYPQAFTSSNDQRDLYKVSHKLRASDRLETGTLNADIALTYAATYDLLQLVKSKFPNVTYHHEIESLFKYTHAELKASGESIVICCDTTQTLMIVKNGQQLKLINRYDTKDLDDVFYFVMLAVEQLELDIEHLTLNWVDASDDKSYNGIADMFASYIKKISKIDLHPSISSALSTAITCA